jgi:hypothetical protein
LIVKDIAASVCDIEKSMLDCARAMGDIDVGEDALAKRAWHENFLGRNAFQPAV